MFRLFFTYLLPLIFPALLYLVWNWMQLRRSMAGERPEPPPGFADMPWLILFGAGVSLLFITLLALSLYGGGSPPDSTYIPPHMEDGKLIPGQMR
jgi:hypothetical protein